MPRKTPPTSPAPESARIAETAPRTNEEVAKSVAEMCASQGWQAVFIPSLKKRRNVIWKSIVEAPDLNKSFAGELMAIKILDSIIGAEANNAKLLALLHSYGNQGA